MVDNSVINGIFIIRSQAEYSTISQTMIVRCILEMPVSGQRHGFSDVEALLSALRTELTELHSRIIPADQKEKNK